MVKLISKEKEFFTNLLSCNLVKHNGYFNFVFKKKKYKRSRVLMQLHLDRRLKPWNNVHHKDKNKENDDINNLEVLDVSEHSSLGAGTNHLRKK